MLGRTGAVSTLRLSTPPCWGSPFYYTNQCPVHRDVLRLAIATGPLLSPVQQPLLQLQALRAHPEQSWGSSYLFPLPRDQGLLLSAMQYLKTWIALFVCFSGGVFFCLLKCGKSGPCDFLLAECSRSLQLLE